MTMLPDAGGFTVQNKRPLSSVLPWQVESSFLTSAPLESVETADQPLAVREHVAHVKLHVDLLLLNRLAAQIECQHLELQLVLRKRPGVGLDAKQDF